MQPLSFDEFRELLCSAVQSCECVGLLIQAQPISKLDDVCDSLGQAEIQMELAEHLDVEVTCEQFDQLETLGEFLEECNRQLMQK